MVCKHCVSDWIYLPPLVSCFLLPFLLRPLIQTVWFLPQQTESQEADTRFPNHPPPPTEFTFPEAILISCNILRLYNSLIFFFICGMSRQAEPHTHWPLKLNSSTMVKAQFVQVSVTLSLIIFHQLEPFQSECFSRPQACVRVSEKAVRLFFGQ